MKNDISSKEDSRYMIHEDDSSESINRPMIILDFNKQVSRPVVNKDLT